MKIVLVCLDIIYCVCLVKLRGDSCKHKCGGGGGRGDVNYTSITFLLFVCFLAQIINNTHVETEDGRVINISVLSELLLDADRFFQQHQNQSCTSVWNNRTRTRNRTCRPAAEVSCSTAKRKSTGVFHPSRAWTDWDMCTLDSVK